MPASPALAENLARGVVAQYAEAERLLLERMARNLAKGIGGPFWAEQKLAQMTAYRQQTEALLAQLQQRAKTGIDTAMTKAYERGGLAAVSDMHTLGQNVIEPLAGARALDALVQETYGNVSQLHPRILRETMNAYQTVIGAGEQAALQGTLRQVTAEAAQQAILGAQTTQQAVQAALDQYAQKGITGFVDRAGRSWSMETYTEMAVRNGAGKAGLAGHEERLTANGFDLVIVSDAPRECPLCRPHEGKVYSQSGTSTEYPSLESARADGLFHVGCRHSVSAYQEGITPPITNTADPEGYEATTKLRGLERKVRESKRMEAAALDPAARAKATRRLNGYREQIRDHVATTSAKRQPWRESFGVSAKKLGKVPLKDADKVTAGIFKEEWEDELSAIAHEAERSGPWEVERAITEWYTGSGGPGSRLDLDPVMLKRVYDAGEPIRKRLRELVGDNVRLYRGVGARIEGSTLNREAKQVVESWTQRKQTAIDYATHGGFTKAGKLLDQAIPVDDIIFAYARGGEFTVVHDARKTILAMLAKQLGR